MFCWCKKVTSTVLKSVCAGIVAKQGCGWQPRGSAGYFYILLISNIHGVENHVFKDIQGKGERASRGKKPSSFNEIIFYEIRFIGSIVDIHSSRLCRLISSIHLAIWWLLIAVNIWIELTDNKRIAENNCSRVIVRILSGFRVLFFADAELQFFKSFSNLRGKKFVNYISLPRLGKEKPLSPSSAHFSVCFEVHL